jgi:5'-3' exoribonuclease 2
MGVPAFFRWLTIRYPKVVVDALTDYDIQLLQDEFMLNNSGAASKDTSTKKGQKSLADRIAASNPTIDNLYLDMNGIIHPCSHPTNGDP